MYEYTIRSVVNERSYIELDAMEIVQFIFCRV